MSATDQSGPVRAGVTRPAVEFVRAAVGDAAEVLCIEDGLDLDTVDFLIPGLGRDVIEAVPRLRRLAVIQTLSAGVDRFTGAVPDRVTLCSSRGARDPVMTEWVLGALLGTSSHLLEHARTQTSHRRVQEDLASWTVLIIGMGSIGRSVARGLRALGTTVIGIASQARDDVHGPEELMTLLPVADAVVLLTPLNDQTRGLIGAAALGAMQDGAVLVNAGRGPVVDTGALVHETSTGRLRAVLDVTDPEPLPEDHPLRSASGVLSITPHIAGDSPRAVARAAQFAGEQLARWCAGEPLRNVVQPGHAAR